MDCNSCGVRFRCPLAAEPGSFMCILTRVQYGGQKERPYQTPGGRRYVVTDCTIDGKWRGDLHTSGRKVLAWAKLPKPFKRL